MKVIIAQNWKETARRVSETFIVTSTSSAYLKLTWTELNNFMQEKVAGL